MKNKINLFKTKRFVPLFITQFFGAFNDNAFKNAFLIWFTYDVSNYHGLDAPTMLTFASGLFILPFFLFSATAGQFADKLERSMLTRQIKLIEVILMIFCCLFFLIKSVSGLLIVLFFMGVQSTFFGPIKYSLLPEHLKESELIAGNAWLEGGTFLSILLGTIFGGIVITLSNGIIYLAISLILFSFVGYVSAIFIPKAKIQDSELKINWNFMLETLKIINYTRKNERVWLSILGISWFWFIGITFLTLFPVYTINIIGGDNILVTFFMSIFSIGIAVGSALCDKILNGEITAKFVAKASLGISLSIFLFFVSSWFYLENFTASEFVGNEKNYIDLMEFFTMNMWSFFIILSLLLLSISGGIYIVPLYAIMQHLAEKKHLSRIIAGNNIINSLFMVLASILSSIFLIMEISSLGIFLLVGITNFLAFIYIFNHMYRRKNNV